MRRSISLLIALLGLTAIPAVASAQQSAPTATTGAATSVKQHSAVLNGTVRPNGTNATWLFQYGTTTAYGRQTPAGTVTAGQGAKSVSATIGGLASGTVYHFRLVASNSGGTTAGVDHTFKTKGLPPSSPTFVTLGANVEPVKYGHLVLLSGVVTSRAAGDVVTLQQRPYPYTTPFKQVGNSVLTDATGMFSLTVAPLLNTQYRAVARKAGTNFFSPVILERVRISVTTQVSDTTPRKGQRVRFHGSAKPPHVGALVRVQRRTGTGGYVTIAKAHLHAFSTTRSTYSLHARIRTSGYYRVRVSTPDSDHVSGIGTRRHLRVH